jgi:hypothetical protein
MLTAAWVADARRERDERVILPQPARHIGEPTPWTVTGTMPPGTMFVRARPVGEALWWSPRPVIAHGKFPKRKMSFE